MMSPGCYTSVEAVTPSDADKIRPTAALYIGVTGDVVVVMAGAGDTTATFKAVPVGVLPIAVKQVKSTGTTATNILALR